jgi:hypothetical protein
MHGVVGWLFQRAALSGTRHAMQMIGLKPKWSSGHEWNSMNRGHSCYQSPM